MKELSKFHGDIREHMDALLTYSRRRAHISLESSSLKAQISEWVVSLDTIPISHRDRIASLLTRLGQTIEDEVEVSNLVRDNMIGLGEDMGELLKAEMEMIQEVEAMQKRLDEYERRLNHAES